MSLSPSLLLLIAAFHCFIILGITGEARCLERPRVELSISFTIERQMLHGSARITQPAGQPLELSAAGLTITDALISRHNQGNSPLTVSQGDTLFIEPSSHPQTLLLSYEKDCSQSRSNRIADDAIVLTRGWHPVLVGRALFSLQAQVPPGFIAISESDSFVPNPEDTIATFSFSQPVHAVSFAAAPYQVQSREIRPDLSLYTLFFPEDEGLAADYLDHAERYIEYFEQLIGPFPYRHYAIVANRLPTGLGMPTYTLLGQQVLRLPFIKTTSLGHEILHSWFGNSVEPAWQSGNWSEGLTTYLADMNAFLSPPRKTAERKQTIDTYLSYVTDNTPPLAQFKAAGHNQRAARPQRAVGYGRGAMLFHELKMRIGEEPFRQTIKELYRQFAGNIASWQDIELLAQEASGLELAAFFEQRLTKVDLPALAITAASTRAEPDGIVLTINIEQTSPTTYEFMLPLEVETGSGLTRYSALIDGKKSVLNLRLDEYPLSITLDPEFDLMRRFSEGERPPSWAHLMGQREVTLIIDDSEDDDGCAEVVEFAQEYGWSVESGGGLSASDTAAGYFLFCGAHHPAVRGLFGTIEHDPNGFTLEVRTHPLAPERVVGIISTADSAQSGLATKRLRHYGTYSYLHFVDGTLQQSIVAQTPEGISRKILEPPTGASVEVLRGLPEIIGQLRDTRVVYVGETHTSWADHLLQLLVIEALHKQNRNLAIGMEMFPRSSQAALDEYIFDTSVSEAEFLKRSRYDEVWGFDVRLFRPIFAFARNHGIPLVALNLDREIVNFVYTTAQPEDLEADRQRHIPADRHLDLPGYYARLRAVHEMHGGDAHGAGSLAGFIQAQSIWDDGMAESIHRYLVDNPHIRMVVLAGSQHTRKDSGIPPRLSKRMEVSQAIIANLATSPLSGRTLAETVDYFMLLDAEPLPAEGKIGIILTEVNEAGAQGVKIEKITNNSKAEEAGLRQGDIVLRLAGTAVSSRSDIRAAMRGRLVGEVIEVQYTTPADGTMETKTTQIELVPPSPAH